MRNLLFASTLFLTSLAVSSRVAIADEKPKFIVVVQAANKTTTISKGDLRALFLKKTTRWKDDATVVPLDLPLDSPLRESFSQHVMGKSAQAVQSEWRQRIFTGQGVPPKELKDDATVIATVGATAGSIGYVAADAKLPDTVHVITVSE